MNEKIDSFCKELRAKLDGVDKRIKDLKAGAKSATEKASVEAKAQLAALENRARDQRAKVQATEAKTKLEEFVARRTKMAETKIQQAEAQALADVRAAAADAAVAAAEKILTRTVKGEVAEGLINKGVQDLKSKLN